MHNSLVSVPVSQATRRSILILSFAGFSSMAVQRVCDAMLPELTRVFAVPLSEASNVVSLFAIVYGIAQLFYGPLGDRLGKFKVVTFATLACSVGSLMAALATSLDALVMARMLVAAGAAALIPLSMAWVGDMVQGEPLQEMLARVGLGTTLGIVAGQLVGGLFTDLLGWRWAFVFLALLFVVVGSLLFRDGLKQGIYKPVTLSETKTVRLGFVEQALSIICGPWSRVILLAAVTEGAAGMGVVAMWASHLHHQLDLSLTAAGSIVALFGIGGVAYMGSARWVIKQFGETGLALWGGLTVCVCALVIAFVPYWQASALASLMSGFGFFMFHNTLQAHAARMSPMARGTAVSLFAGCLFLGQSLGVTLAASLTGLIGTPWVVASGGIVIGLLGTTMCLQFKRRSLT